MMEEPVSRPAISVKRVREDEQRSFTELWMSARVEAGVSPRMVTLLACTRKVTQEGRAWSASAGVPLCCLTR